jgi:hypothetical protein
MVKTIGKRGKEGREQKYAKRRINKKAQLVPDHAPSPAALTD